MARLTDEGPSQRRWGLVQCRFMLQPIRGQCPGHEFTPDQSEASILASYQSWFIPRSIQTHIRPENGIIVLEIQVPRDKLITVTILFSIVRGMSLSRGTCRSGLNAQKEVI